MIMNYEQFNENYVDKRTDTKPKDVIQKAVDEIRSLGYKNPFDNSTVIDDRVLVEVSNFDGYLWLNSIFTVDKRQGFSSKVLQMICDIADKYQITMRLTPVPFGTGEIMNTKQLTKWYSKFGFVKFRLEDMKRPPKPLSEKQMKLFNFEEPTDTEIAHTFINKHKSDKPFTRPTNYRTLEEGFDAWSDEKHLNDLLYKEMVNQYESTLFTEFLWKHQDDLIEYIMENPDKSINDEINNILTQYEDDENRAHREIKKIMDNESDWYYNYGEYISDADEFQEKLLNDNKNTLYQDCETDYFDELQSAIWKSTKDGDDSRLLVYRAVTLPDTIENLEELKYSGVGVYWTYDFDKAEAYWSNHNREFILCAYADTNCIDWETTVHHSIYGLKEEREIKIWKGADLELVSVFMAEYYKKVDLEKEKNKISQMFKSKNDAVNDYVIGKYKNLATVTFEEPVQVVA